MVVRLLIPLLVVTVGAPFRGPGIDAREDGAALVGVLAATLEGTRHTLAGVPVEVRSTCAAPDAAAPVTVSYGPGRFALQPEDLGLVDGRLRCPVELVATLATWTARARLTELPETLELTLMAPEGPVPAAPEIRGHVFLMNYGGLLVPAPGVLVEFKRRDPTTGELCPGRAAAVTTDAEGGFSLKEVPACSGAPGVEPLEPGRDYRLWATVAADPDWGAVNHPLRLEGPVHHLLLELPRVQRWFPVDGLRRGWKADD